jgi:hypothetical protein
MMPGCYAIGDAVTASRTSPIWWPHKQPNAVVDQTFDAGTLPNPIRPGQIEALTVQVAPSGVGELAVQNVWLYDSVITLQVSGGQPGRVYVYLFTATLADGQDVQWTIGQAVTRLLPGYPTPPPPAPGFGTEISWMPIIQVASGLVATGTTPATAVNLGALTNVFNTVLPGALANLPAWLTNGSVKIINMGANVLSMVPPTGAQINALGPNTQVGISPGGSATFSTSAPLAQWTSS